jgi:tetratricopeptide (TPR) repeat protein
VGVDSTEPEYQRLAREAIEWYGRSLRLNPYNARACAAYGWCLDWLNRTEEAGEYFARAEELDPNNYYILNSIGRHQVERRNYAAAKPWFERSLRLEWADNPVARAYLQLADQNLRTAATNEFRGQLNLLAP